MSMASISLKYGVVYTVETCQMYTFCDKMGEF